MDNVLSRVNGFHRIPSDGLSRLLRHGTPRSFAAGSTIMRQGEPGDTMLVLLSGKVRVERSHPDLKAALPLAELGPHQVVGEMGVLDQAPRSATVVAMEDTEALELSAEVVAQTIVRYPVVSMDLLRMLSSRLRDTDELATHLASRARNGGN